MSCARRGRETVVGLCLLAVGCGQNATVRQGTIEHDVRILRSTPSQLIVLSNDGETSIPRDQVTDIDHPGKVLAIAGIPLIALGVANLLGVWNCGDGRDDHAFCMGSGVGFLTASGGLLLTIWGLVNYTRSVQAAAAPPLLGP